MPLSLRRLDLPLLMKASQGKKGKRGKEINAHPVEAAATVVAQRWHRLVIIQAHVFLREIRAANIAVGAALLGKDGDGHAHGVGCRIGGGRVQFHQAGNCSWR